MTAPERKPMRSDHFRVALFVPEYPSELDAPSLPPSEILEGQHVDVLLLPEGWSNAQNLDRAIRQSTALAKTVGIHVLFGSSENGWEVLRHVEPDGRQRIEYRKHSTASRVAFDSPDWSPKTDLPVFSINGVTVGATICHDLYLGLLQRHLARAGARVWFNPSFDSTNAMSLKWQTALRLRSVELGIASLCTMHEFFKMAHSATPFGYLSNGQEATSTLPNYPSVPISRAEDRDLHLVDIELAPPPASRDPFHLLAPSSKKAGAEARGDAVSIRLAGESPEILSGRAWKPAMSSTTPAGRKPVWVIPVEGRELLDSSVFFRGLLEAESHGCRPVFWNIWNEGLPTEPSRLIDLLLGRALENCATIVLSDRRTIYEVAEVASDTKSLRRRIVESAMCSINVERAWGLSSAFKQVAKHLVSTTAAQALERYLSLAKEPEA
ncbi:hypothetical protein KJ940_03100 [Myxococcota bacterium]|nr:hypothetical protein [Myxococcota bacterium]